MKQPIRILFALAVCAVTPAMADVISAYYLFNGDAAVAQVVQGSSIINTWATSGRLYPPAIADTVRVYPFDRTSGVGVEYTLAGAATGNTYPWTRGGPTGGLTDGTTDGERYNYAAEWSGTHSIWQYDREWANPILLFGVNGRPTGLTYDGTDGTLWVVIDGGGGINNFDLAGNLLSSFSFGSGRIGSLAWEPATDTLWGYVNDSGRELRNWAKDGTLLETLFVDGISGNTWGGEFQIPEPASASLLSIGMLFVIRRRR